MNEKNGGYHSKLPETNHLYDLLSFLLHCYKGQREFRVKCMAHCCYGKSF